MMICNLGRVVVGALKDDDVTEICLNSRDGQIRVANTWAHGWPVYA